MLCNSGSLVFENCPGFGFADVVMTLNVYRVDYRLEKENKGLRYKIFGAIQRGEIDGFKYVGRMQGMKDYEE